MFTLVVRLADLEFLSPHDLSAGLSTAELIDVIRKQFGYLPGEVQVDIADGVATIQFEEASTQDQSEARRLLERAAKRAKTGEFRKAKDIYERVLELDPAMADARRELAGNLNAHVSELFGRVTNDLSVWATLSGEHNIDLFCVYFMSEADEGVETSAETLKALGDRGIKLGLRIYSPAEEDGN